MGRDRRGFKKPGFDDNQAPQLAATAKTYFGHRHNVWADDVLVIRTPFAFRKKWKLSGSWKYIAVRRIRFDSPRVILMIDGKLQLPEVRNLGPKIPTTCWGTVNSDCTMNVVLPSM
jgi:hypothetical protein